jgi:hypothetical protein
MWEPQPLTTLRTSKACRGENFTFYKLSPLVIADIERKAVLQLLIVTDMKLYTQANNKAHYPISISLLIYLTKLSLLKLHAIEL